jgi:hypothetical protein
MAAMFADEMDAETRRVRDEVADRLRRAGVPTSPSDSPGELARLLEAVEDFERTVQARGGDLMVDEPAGARRPEQPDDADFVIPERVRDEPVETFINRLADARRRAARSPGQGPTSNVRRNLDDL